MSLSIRLSGRRGRLDLDCDLTLPEHGVTAIFGPSGAGKTSLLRAVAGLERIDGRVALGSRVWQDTAARTWLPPERREVGFVFQEGALFPHLSVGGNLEYADRRATNGTGLERREVIAMVGLERLLERRPGELSAGQRQRVALGRALLARPRLLLLDEPLANLDREAREEILSALEALGRRFELPTLYVTHSWAEVDRLADQVVRLSGGKTEAPGAPQEIAAQIDPEGDWDGEIGVLVAAQVASHDEDLRLTELNFSGGKIRLPQRDLEVGRHLRVRFLARDISLTRQRAEETSILNIFSASVLEIRGAESSQPLVTLQVGEEVLLARISYGSLLALRLEPGSRVWAQVKGVALRP
ncbi:MAG: molybdenum ABC transporter ATP-binding protein [Thermoanaerobaculia bacterium]|nr:molybdenum ABC transporter ATP-binding protein [Thermoanaerobaculia bacterium]